MTAINTETRMSLHLLSRRKADWTHPLFPTVRRLGALVAVIACATAYAIVNTL